MFLHWYKSFVKVETSRSKFLSDESVTEMDKKMIPSISRREKKSHTVTAVLNMFVHEPR